MTATNAIVSIPTPRQANFHQRPGSGSIRWTAVWSTTTTSIVRFTPPLCSSSPSSTSSLVEEDTPPSVPSDDVSAVAATANDLPLGGCKTCGKEEIERGCNGEGRIQGGIATVPGFGWWPIKAYRPCPGFLASGGRYRRQGQSMDEVAFGRAGRQAVASDDDNQRDKKKSPMKFKR
ncbi:hypothetical protein RJ641_035697 [Dillenia turbinata]|uniref:Uncharacterized protein n=1 Tax=Dillenia turbinata TaxID=194707 RepID=A0AAN8VTQ3_9MAGN